MKKYLLFSGKSYYAVGGIFDLIASFNSIEECEYVWQFLESKPDKIWDNYDWAHVLDITTGEIIMLQEGSYCGTSEV